MLTRFLDRIDPVAVIATVAALSVAAFFGCVAACAVAFVEAVL